MMLYGFIYEFKNSCIDEDDRLETKKVGDKLKMLVTAQAISYDTPQTATAIRCHQDLNSGTKI